MADRSTLLDAAVKAHAPSIKPRKKRGPKLLAEHTHANDDVCVASSGADVILSRLSNKLDTLEAFMAREGKPAPESFEGKRQARCKELIRTLRTPIDQARSLLAESVEMSVREGEAQLRKANGSNG